MKVLMINTVPTNSNGITNVIFNLLDNMCKEDFEFGYVSINTIAPEYTAHFKRLGVKTYELPMRTSNPVSYWFKFRNIAKEYDAIHVHGNSAIMAMELSAAKSAGVKLRIAHSHNTTCINKRADKLMRGLFYRTCNGRLACGKEPGHWLFDKRSFLVINNGVDTDRFAFNSAMRQEYRKQYGVENETVIGCVGRLNRQKNQLFLLDIFKELKNKASGYKLLLVGGGELEHQVRGKIQSLGMDEDVIMTGSVPNTEAYMSMMDFIVMPSLYEGFPLTLVEEQSSGLRCLVSDVITDDVNFSDSVFFEPLETDAYAWAEKIDNYCGLSDNREERSKRMIEIICKEKFDSHENGVELLEYYTEHIEKS